MASITYDSFVDDTLRGNIDLDGDTFYILLVTSSYSPNKGTHTKRSDVTNEVTSANYTAGGKAVTATIAKDTSGHKVTMTFTDLNWATVTLTARAAVIYKHRGGASSADELVCYLDFGADITATAGTFAVAFGTPITFQN
jgi:hypothetical protein